MNGHRVKLRRQEQNLHEGSAPLDGNKLRGV
jgi:hypothetical protein